MLAKCSNPQCGITFQSNLIKARNSQFTFQDVGTSCPRCGNIANVIDGTHIYDENGIVTALKNIPKSDLLKIQKIAQDTLLNGGSASDFNNAISSVNPTYKTQIEKFIDLSKDENFRHWIDRLLKAIAILIGGAIVNHSLNNVNINIGNKNTTIIEKQSFSSDFEQSLRLRRLNNVNKKTTNENKKFHRKKRGIN